MQQFLEVFPEMKAKKLYLTGESVRHSYVPENHTVFADAINSSMRGHMCHVCCSYPDTKGDF